MQFNTAILLANASPLLFGALVTMFITGLSLTLGMFIGIVICWMQLSKSKSAVRMSRAYVAVFRTIPEMVLIFWAYFCLPAISGVALSGLISGCIALGLASGAYLAEIYRAGICAVPDTQREAGVALALPKYVLWTRVIIPQATRFMIPPFLNYFTELLKNTTLVAAIGVGELSYVAYTLGGVTFRYFEFMSAIAIVYFIIIFFVARYADYTENRIYRHRYN